MTFSSWQNQTGSDDCADSLVAQSVNGQLEIFQSAIGGLTDVDFENVRYLIKIGYLRIQGDHSSSVRKVFQSTFHERFPNSSSSLDRQESSNL